VRCAGALWKLSMSEDNVKTFQELELVPVLINLLKENAEGLDDLQFNVGKIQVRIFLKFEETVSPATGLCFRILITVLHKYSLYSLFFFLAVDEIFKTVSYPALMETFSNFC
jgi:hypothetical protein